MSYFDRQSDARILVIKARVKDPHQAAINAWESRKKNKAAAIAAAEAGKAAAAAAAEAAKIAARKPSFAKAPYSELRDFFASEYGVTLHNYLPVKKPKYPATTEQMSAWARYKAGPAGRLGTAVDLDGRTPSAKRYRQMLSAVSDALDHLRSIGVEPKDLRVPVELVNSTPRRGYGGVAYLGRRGLAINNTHMSEDFITGYMGRVKARGFNWNSIDDYLLQMDTKAAVVASIRHTFIHELAHNQTTGDYGFFGAKGAKLRDALEAVAKDNGVSTAAWARRHLSEYSLKKPTEFIAELAARVLDPSYKRGELPAEMESYVDQLFRRKPV